MNEDQLLRELAHLVREEEKTRRSELDERWDRLAAGELTAEEEAALRALAESSPEAREAYEAFQPLGAGFQARVVSALAAELEQRPASAEPRPPRSRLLPFRPPVARLGGWLAAAGTMAAALFFLLRGPSTLPPLPAYTAEMSRGVQTSRAEGGRATGTPVFVPGSLLTLAARPRQAVAGPVEAKALLARGGELVAWEPQPRLEIAGGAVRLQGRLGQEVLLPPGRWRIWLVVGRPGRIPPLPELAGLLAKPAPGSRHEDWQAVHADLRVEGGAAP